jgi:H+/gluconate symporter-like permease
MKKHLLGICVALFIFGGFFYVLPIIFETAKGFRCPTTTIVFGIRLYGGGKAFSTNFAPRRYPFHR